MKKSILLIATLALAFTACADSPTIIVGPGAGGGGGEGGGGGGGGYCTDEICIIFLQLTEPAAEPDDACALCTEDQVCADGACR